MQTVHVGHKHGPDELLHAVEPHDLHVHDALDFIEDVLRDVRADADHPLERPAQLQPELPEYECVKAHQ